MPRGAVEPAASEEPAGEQRFGERRRERIASRRGEYLEALGEARARAAQRLGHPGERQARLSSARHSGAFHAPSASRFTACGSARSAKMRCAASVTGLAMRVR